MFSIKTVLHPTDFSEHSRYALSVACALARDAGARLVVLHTVPKATPVIGDGDMAALQEAERYQEDLRIYRQEMAKKLRTLPLPGLPDRTEHLLKEGEPATVILAAAEDVGADLIVMGTHGRTGHARELMGSVAEEVLQAATCPVLMINVPVTRPTTAMRGEPEEAELIL